MAALDWSELTRRFRRVPALFRMQTVAEKSTRGKPIVAHRRPPIALAFSPDSRRIAVSGGGLIPGAVDIRVFDVATRELVRICDAHVMGVFTLAFDPATGILASASHDYSVILWNLEMNESIFLAGDPDEGISRRAAAFAGTRVLIADGMTFAGATAALTAIDLATGQSQVLYKLGPGEGIAQLDVVSEKAIVVAIDDPRDPGPPQLRVVELSGRERVRSRMDVSIYRLAAIDERTIVATGATEGHEETLVFVAEARGAKRTRTRTLGREIGASIALSPRGGEVAIAYDRGIDLASLETLEPRLHLELGEDKACSVAWSPDGRWIAAGTIARTLRLFDASSGSEHLV